MDRRMYGSSTICIGWWQVPPTAMIATSTIIWKQPIVKSANELTLLDLLMPRIQIKILKNKEQNVTNAIKQKRN